MRCCVRESRRFKLARPSAGQPRELGKAQRQRTRKSIHERVEDPHRSIPLGASQSETLATFCTSSLAIARTCVESHRQVVGRGDRGDRFVLNARGKWQSCSAALKLKSSTMMVDMAGNCSLKGTLVGCWRLGDCVTYVSQPIDSNNKDRL